MSGRKRRSDIRTNILSESTDWAPSSSCMAKAMAMIRTYQSYYNKGTRQAAADTPSAVAVTIVIQE